VWPDGRLRSHSRPGKSSSSACIECQRCVVRPQTARATWEGAGPAMKRRKITLFVMPRFALLIRIAAAKIALK
jgi:hypothetical protein